MRQSGEINSKIKYVFVLNIDQCILGVLYLKALAMYALRIFLLLIKKKTSFYSSMDSLG